MGEDLNGEIKLDDKEGKRRAIKYVNLMSDRPDFKEIMMRHILVKWFAFVVSRHSFEVLQVCNIYSNTARAFMDPTFIIM